MGGAPLNSSTERRSLDRLDGDANWRLGLLVAPAGAGKTKALRRWARRQAKEHGMRLAWLSLRPAHNQPGRFLNDLLACLDNPHPGQGHLSESNDIKDNQLGIEGEMVDLINNLAGANAPVTLILDNYELIQSGPIHQALKLLVEYLPPQARLVIATRVEPPLQIPRLRARRQLLELGPADLDLG
jgi:LuxR family transcriptional regulator, maltose regulon positive regulatory protein